MLGYWLLLQFVSGLIVIDKEEGSVGFGGPRDPWS
jgi:hypothetical protein